MVLNRQRGIRVSIRRLERFAVQASELLRLAPDSVTVCLVSNAQIARWNRAYRGKNEPTDVLSFAAESGAAKESGSANVRRQRNANRVGQPSGRFRKSADFETRPRYLGDIAIAPNLARRNALRLGRKFEDEMRILILHGMLHLLGYDHETDNGQMDRRERKLRRALQLK